MQSQLSSNNHITDFLCPLFWEYDPATLDIAAHADLIIGRIMVEGRGRRTLPPRELNYCALMCGVDEEHRRQWVEDARNSTDVWRTRIPRALFGQEPFF